MTLTLKRAGTAAAVATAFAMAAGSASAVGLLGLTDANQLLSFDSALPGSTSAVSITGLAAGERVISIDLRNPDNTVYGLSTLGNLYALNTSTGAATSIGSGLTPAASGSTSYEIDWNPSNNNLRIAGNGAAGSTNGAYNFSTGATAANTSFTRADAGGALDVVGVAYNNNFVGSNTTNLSSFFLDANSDALFVNTNAFAGGVLTKVGDLTLGGFAYGISGPTGFEITGAGQAFVSLRENLFSINVATGALTPLGSIGPSYNVIGLTSAVPEPQSYALMLAGLAVMGAFAKRRSQG